MSSIISKVKQKLKQVKFRHLKEYLSENLKEDPRNCAHNEITTSPTGEVGTCAYDGSSFFGNICDVSFNKDMSRDCGLFCPTKSKELLKKEFFEFIDNSSLGEVAKEFPDVTALIWVLTTLGADGSDIELEEHYEKIEQATVANHNLSSVVQDLKNMLKLHTHEIQQVESDNKLLQAELQDQAVALEQSEKQLVQLKSEKDSLTTDLDIAVATVKDLRGVAEDTRNFLAVEMGMSNWQRFVRWLK